ncbi:MAG: hypothetical protein QNJ98_16875 [Planctomycetota bacterium]|nr:hypothetical protein [Planctomycetota bacterium]
MPRGAWVRGWLLIGALALLAPLAAAAPDETLELGWVPETPPGAPERAHPLLATSPAGVVAPAGAVEAAFASLVFAESAPLPVAVDVKASPPVLWLDRDGNGRFDPAERLELATVGGTYVARFQTDLVYLDRPDVLPCDIELVYRPAAAAGRRLATRAQGYRRVRVVVGGRLRRIGLVDGNGDLCFDDPEQDFVVVDQDADGRFDVRVGAVERSTLAEPIRLGRRAFTLRVTARDGRGAELVRSPAHAGRALRRGGEAAPVALDRMPPDATVRERAESAIRLHRMRHPLALDAAAALVEASGLTDPQRRGLAQILSESGEADHVDALVRLYQRIGLPEPIRERIVRSLTDVRDEDATERWAALLGNTSRRMRVVGIRLLAAHPDDAAVQALVKHGPREDDERVLDALIEALASRPDAGAAAFLIESAKRGGRKRDVAVRALGRIGFGVPAVRTFFGRLLGSNNERERMLALDLVAGSEHIDFCPRVAPSLLHRSWEVRQAAIEALAALRCQSSVTALIERIDKEPRRRLRIEMGKALFTLTGVYFYEDAKRWGAWWAEHGESFEFPTEALSLPLGDGDTTEGFYGLPLESDHVLFVIDRSGSMNAVAEAVTGATRWTIAKREVLRAARPIGSRGAAGVLLFATGVSSWQPRLRRMGPTAQRGLADWLGRSGPGGGTNLYDALARAYEYVGADTIFVVSDGVPSAGRYKSAPQVLRAVDKLAAGRRVRVHCVSVGMDSRLLEQIATLTGGRYARR